jgi:hypothetical protein
MKAVSLAVMLLFMPLPAQAYSCETIRWAYRTYGKAKLLDLAKQYKITPAQMRAAKACLRRGRR